jgi:hypothetical protein
MRALLRKEWREHRWALLAVLLLVACGEGIFLLAASQMGSPMIAYQKMTAVVAPMVALILVHRLVVREYMGRTQLFLETLPVSRSQVLSLKWLLGVLLLLLSMAACLGLTLLASRGKVLLTPHFIALVAARSAAFIVFSYALAFFVGLTGRYRLVLWFVLPVCVFLADTASQVGMAKWAPFHLVQEAMVYERLKLPLSSVLITCALAAALLVATLALGLSAEGSLVVALSRRMSSREKSAVTIGILGLIGASTVIETRKPKPPFVLQQAMRSASAGPKVAVGISGPAPQAAALANVLAADLARLQAFLALADAPALTALPDDNLDGDAYQRAALADADGVVVRAAFTGPQFDREGFRAYALAVWLHWYSRGVAAREDRRWLLDGTTQWLVARDLPGLQEKLALRAAFAARLLQLHRNSSGAVQGQSLMGGAIDQWLTTRETLGPCLSNALAWRMVSSLAARLGEPRFTAMSRALLAARPSNDARASLFPGSLDRLLAQAGAPDRATLARELDALLTADQARLAASVGKIAVPRIALAAHKMAGSTFEVRYSLGGADGATLYAVRYVSLGPWDAEIAPELMARVDATRDGVLPASYARGTRLYTAVERREDVLGCNIRLASQRWEVK